MLTGRYPNSIAAKLHAQRAWSKVVRPGIRLAHRVNADVTPMFWFATDNFGDAIAPFIVRRATQLRPYLMVDPCPNRLLSVGSIVHRAAPGDLLWGCGSLTPDVLDVAADVDVVAVRGPLTAQVLGRASRPGIPMGDPVQLLPDLYQGKPAPITGRIGLVPHHADLAKLADHPMPGVTAISPLSRWRSVVDRILKCEIVLSSSLHGLIVAEAYGVPAVWIRIGELPYGGTHKFHDYLLASGRPISQPISFDPAAPTSSPTPLPAPPPPDPAFRASAVAVAQRIHRAA